MNKILPLLFTALFLGAAQFPTTSPVAPPLPCYSCSTPLCTASDTMLLIKGGKFQMGSDDQSDATPVHSVTLSNFYLAATETTNAQYCAFLNEKGNQPEGDLAWIEIIGKYEQEKCRIQQYGSRFVVEPGYDHYPIIYVSWHGAKAYCDWRTAKSQGQRQYRLPTEAEWEYAAGGGQAKRTKWAGTSEEAQLYHYGNFCDTKCNEYWQRLSQTDGYAYTAPVGQLEGNVLGLFDMSGNVREWCNDRYDADYYRKSPANNPTGPAIGGYRVFRGGGWDDYLHACLVDRRDSGVPTTRSVRLGFRVAL